MPLLKCLKNALSYSRYSFLNTGGCIDCAIGFENITGLTGVHCLYFKLMYTVMSQLYDPVAVNQTLVDFARLLAVSNKRF